MRLPLLPRLRFGSRLVSAAAMAALVATTAACAGRASAAPTTIPSAAAGACPSAPEPGNLPDWQPPATAPQITPVIIANPGELTCGRNRMLFTFLDTANNVVSKPELEAKVSLYDLGRDPSRPVASSVPGTFIWAIENERGVYVATVDFPEAGTYGAEFATGGGTAPTLTRVTFSVSAATSVVQVGQKAPATKTPTSADVGGRLAEISTDSTPDPDLYGVSVDAAIAEHKPFVVIFATPKFCTSAQCGPTLDRIKPFVAKYPGVAFIHVEPYELKLDNGTLQPVLDASGNLTATSVTNEWGLVSEPWVFVVDRDGIVRASLELIFSDAELTAALDSVK
jgi:hypothetical protein